MLASTVAESIVARRQTAAKTVRILSLGVAGFAVLCALVVVLTASRTAAQGCAQCYQSAAASGVAGRAALRHGILILLVPAISLFLAILSLLCRRRNPARPAPVGKFSERMAGASSNSVR